MPCEAAQILYVNRCERGSTQCRPRCADGRNVFCCVQETETQRESLTTFTLYTSIHTCTKYVFHHQASLERLLSGSARGGALSSLSRDQNYSGLVGAGAFPTLPSAGGGGLSFRPHCLKPLDRFWVELNWINLNEINWIKFLEVTLKAGDMIKNAEHPHGKLGKILV